jgi:CubicO group peptidase (beta-lactamase class C family)
MKSVTRVFILLVFAMATPLLSAAQTSKQLTEFDRFVKKGMKDWDIPGLAVVVVKNNKIIYEAGLGVKELGKPDLVDTQTIFACASTTKAMTAACIGMLVDEGKLKWNDKVVRHLPEFRLYDPYITSEITIRDLLTHNTGVGNADFLWGSMHISSEEILRRMAMVKPSYSMRSSFIYQNIFYLVAGAVIERVSGKPWGEFIHERIFNPLEMKRTVPFSKDALKLGNQTSAHFKIKGKVEVITHSNADDIAPAGAVWASIHDMGKWTLCMLDSGKYAGGRLVQPQTWSELFKPQVVVPDEEFYPSMQLTLPNWKTYGLGWFQHDYKGSKVNFHTGSLDGSVAIHAQLPDHKLGIYVFSNLDHAEFRHALIYKTFDLFALGGTRDWSADLRQVYNERHLQAEKVAHEFEAKREQNTKPSVSLDQFAGTYKDDLFGEVSVTVVSDKLAINVNDDIYTQLDHWHYNTFRGPYEKKWWGDMTVTFELNETGTVSRVNVEGFDLKKVE